MVPDGKRVVVLASTPLGTAVAAQLLSNGSIAVVDTMSPNDVGDGYQCPYFPPVPAVPVADAAPNK
jgi:hypothetical protein